MSTVQEDDAGFSSDLTGGIAIMAILNNVIILLYFSFHSKISSNQMSILCCIVLTFFVSYNIINFILSLGDNSLRDSPFTCTWHPYLCMLLYTTFRYCIYFINTEHIFSKYAASNLSFPPKQMHFIRCTLALIYLIYFISLALTKDTFTIKQNGECFANYPIALLIITVIIDFAIMTAIIIMLSRRAVMLDILANPSSNSPHVKAIMDAGSTPLPEFDTINIDPTYMNHNAGSTPVTAESPKNMAFANNMFAGNTPVNTNKNDNIDKVMNAVDFGAEMKMEIVQESPGDVVAVMPMGVEHTDSEQPMNVKSHGLSLDMLESRSASPRDVRKFVHRRHSSDEVMFAFKKLHILTVISFMTMQFVLLLSLSGIINIWYTLASVVNSYIVLMMFGEYDHVFGKICVCADKHYNDRYFQKLSFSDCFRVRLNSADIQKGMLENAMNTASIESEMKNEKQIPITIALPVAGVVDKPTVFDDTIDVVDDEDDDDDNEPSVNDIK